MGGCGVVAKAVEKSTHLHAFGRFLGEHVEEHAGDGVVAEVEVLQWMLWRACRMVWKRSSNFSWPLFSSTMELLSEKLTPSCRMPWSISESALCPEADVQKHRSMCATSILIFDLQFVQCFQIIQR